MPPGRRTPASGSRPVTPSGVQGETKFPRRVKRGPLLRAGEAGAGSFEGGVRGGGRKKGLSSGVRGRGKQVVPRAGELRGVGPWFDTGPWRAGELREGERCAESLVTSVTRSPRPSWCPG